jgi:hypothetical protein
MRKWARVRGERLGGGGDRRQECEFANYLSHAQHELNLF